MQQEPMIPTEQTQQLVSALADGELQGAEFERALELLRADPQARANWHAYHQLGDLLRRGPRAAVGPQDEAFVARLRARLAQEAPRPLRATLVYPSGQASANDGVWRWKLVAGFCSLAAVAVLAWQLLAPSLTQDTPQLARAATPAVQMPEEAPRVMIRDPRLDQLIAAHQQQGGTSALQMPAGFLRNATFERPAR